MRVREILTSHVHALSDIKSLLALHFEPQNELRRFGLAAFCPSAVPRNPFSLFVKIQDLTFSNQLSAKLILFHTSETSHIQKRDLLRLIDYK
jgi:hypothetical protein